MKQNVLRAIEGVDIYPIISLALFFFIFTTMLVLVIMMKKQTVSEHSNLPLEDGTEKDTNNAFFVSPN